jgi:hypothetical protein
MIRTGDIASEVAAIVVDFYVHDDDNNFCYSSMKIS